MPSRGFSRRERERERERDGRKRDREYKLGSSVNYRVKPGTHCHKKIARVESRTRRNSYVRFLLGSRQKAIWLIQGSSRLVSYEISRVSTDIHPSPCLS